jgi:hypothetical protein
MEQNGSTWIGNCGSQESILQVYHLFMSSLECGLLVSSLCLIFFASMVSYFIIKRRGWFF